MAHLKVTSGMWRIDPQNRSRVIDRFGRTVATTESEAEAYLIASAPDMCEVLEGLENDHTIQQGLWEEIHVVLRRVRGDFGLIFSHCRFPKLRRLWNEEWMTFMERLWKAPGAAEPGPQ